MEIIEQDLAARRRQRLATLNIIQQTFKSAFLLEQEQFSLLAHECTDSDAFRAIKRYEWKIHARTLKTSRLHSPIQKRQRKLLPRNRTFSDIDFARHCFTDTGLPHHYVWSLFLKTQSLIRQPRNPFGSTKKATKCGVSPFSRLYIILCLMRKGEAAAKDLAIRFNVSNAFISRDKKHVIPILYTSISVIRFFKPNIFGWLVHSWKDHLVAGAIDGTCHFRERIHPGQSNWYALFKFKNYRYYK